jgi:hypothetical protein
LGTTSFRRSARGPSKASRRPMSAVRPVELRGALWSEIDVPKALWRVLASRMKMKVEHLVPLSAAALRVIAAMRSLSGSGPLVFPSPFYPGKPLSLVLHNDGPRGQLVAVADVPDLDSQDALLRHRANTGCRAPEWAPGRADSQLPGAPADSHSRPAADVRRLRLGDWTGPEPVRHLRAGPARQSQKSRGPDCGRILTAYTPKSDHGRRCTWRSRPSCRLSNQSGGNDFSVAPASVGGASTTARSSKIAHRV